MFRKLYKDGYTVQIGHDMPKEMIPSEVTWEGDKTIYEIPWLASNPPEEMVVGALHLYELVEPDDKMPMKYRIEGNALVCDKVLTESCLDYMTEDGQFGGTAIIMKQGSDFPESNFDGLFDEERKNEMDPFVSAQNKKRNRNVPAGPAKILGVVVGAGVVLSLISGCFSVIETGERGVVLRFGEYRYTMNEGLNFKAPFIDSVYKLQVRDRNYNSDVEVSSKDMQTIKISSSLVYSLDTQKVGDIYRRYGNNIESTIIKPTVAEIINSTIAQYPIEEFVSKRDEISQKIMGTLKTRMSDIGIDIKSFLITNHDFSDDYNKAIEQKKIAEQAAITAEYNKQKAQLDSEANKYRQEGLSKYVLMEKFLDKWDGHMPRVLTSSDSNMSMILDAQDLK